MRKSILLVTLLCAATSWLALPARHAVAAPKITLKAVSAWPVSHVGNEFYKEFIKRVNERSKGEIEIKLLGGPEVISAFDQLKALSSDVVDLVHAANSYYAGAVPEGTIVDLALPNELIPFLRESGVWNTYTQAYTEKSKAVFLGMTWIGMPFYLMTNKPVTKLDDIKGMKLRSMGGLIDILVGEMGGSVVKIASAEVYEGLQRGVVDGAVRNTISLMEFKEYEVLKYIVVPPICTSSGAVWISEAKWNTIPKDLQELIKKTMIETEKDAFAAYAKMDKEKLKEAQEKHGIKIVSLSDKDIKTFNQIRSGAAVKDWIYKKAPKYGPAIYEKMLPYIK